ncbi:MAG: hypothetical protein AB1344_09065 [Pseudomonadota bacterium]
MKSLLNLYTEELRERPVPYGFYTLLGAMLLTLVVMVVLGLLDQHRLSKLEQQHQFLQSREMMLNQSVKALEAQMTGEEQLAAMEREAARLLQEIDARERGLAELKGMIEQRSAGFSPMLHGLAEASGQGVWLTRIQLDKVGAPTSEPAVRLDGRLREGERLPAYLDALARSDALRGLNFNSMQVQRPEGSQADHDAIRFLLSTRMGDALEEGGR